jgi:hypothetical protein
MKAPLPIALILAASALHSQTVEGTVTNSATGTGIAEVQVMLVRDGRPEYTGKTDDRGKFQFSEVKNGAYTALFFSPAYRAARDGGGKLVTVQQGGGVVQVNAELIPLGKISGRVVDGRGIPVPRTMVTLSNAGFRLSWTTDTAGNFAQENFVLPGTYILEANPPPDWIPPANSTDDRPLGWARTYFPGVAHLEQAAKIVVLPGRELAGLEIKLTTTPAYSMRGAVFDGKGDAVANATVTLGDSTPGRGRRVKSDGGGAFEFTGVTDGDYLLDTVAQAAQPILMDRQWVQMDGHDLKGLRLVLTPLFSLTGRVVMERPEGAPAPQFPMVGLSVRSIGGYPGGQPRLLARPDESGTFKIDGLFHDSYRVNPGPTKPPYYLDSIRLGDREIAGQEMELPSPAPLTVVYKMDGGTIRGTAENCGAGSVVLVPQKSELWRAGFVRWEPCTANGRFEIAAVKPGEYYAVAVGLVPPNLFFPVVEMDSTLIAQASLVTVRAGEATQLDLKMAQGY